MGVNELKNFGSIKESHHCRISLRAVKVLVTFKQIRASDREAGGQLFGYYANGHWQVEFASKPGGLDTRSRFRFRPDRKRQNTQIRKFYRKGIHFLGDWHTHPERVPRPSMTDINTIRRTYAESDTDLPGFLLLIVGNSEPEHNFYLAAVSDKAVHEMHEEVLLRHSLFP